MLSVPVDAATMDETVSHIERRLANGTFTQHVVVNVAKLIAIRRDPALRSAVEACDVISVDGMGVVWGARFLGQRIPERVAGIDLFGRLLQLAAAHGYAVYFLGATPEVVKCAAEICAARYPGLRIAGFRDGYFDNDAAVAEQIARSGARMLFVGMPSPRKETFIDRWKGSLGVDFVMGVGGTFDVVAGKVGRAPQWLQSAGLEWLYRLAQEPRRMLWRYLSTNVQFVWLLIKGRLAGASGRSE